ncbi:MAG: glycosyltransferase family 39 protein [Cyanobacteria bacterium]|nr:glycosyltransferase family 39 protein [Cyanobacteriota bacterium]
MILDNSSKKNNYIFFIVLFLIIIGGFLLILILTSKMGPGLSPDSVAYIAAARNLLNGRGVAVLYNSNGTVPLNLWQPMNVNEIKHVMEWPPGYPITLSLTGIFGLNILTGARWLNAILFGLNIFITSFIIKKITNSIILPIFSGLLFVFSKDMIFNHYMIWSESLFILLAFLGLFFLINYLSENKISFLLLSAFILGLAFLTKYVGATLIIAGVIGILFLNNEKISKKIIRSLIFIVISCLPIGAWFIRFMFLGSGSSVRRINFNPVKVDEIKMMIDAITKWLLPGRFSLNLRIVLTGIFIVLVFSGFVIINKKIKNKKIELGQKQINIASLLFFVFICVYVLFLFITKIFFDANTDIWDIHLLSPVFVASLLIVVFFLKSILNVVNSNKITKKIITVSVYFAFVIFIGFYAAYFFYGNNIYTAGALYVGVGYSRNDWKTSQTIEKLKEFPESTLIYTNEPDAVYILADRGSYMIPSKIDLYSHKANDSYSSQVEVMVKDLKSKKGILVLFKLGLGFLPKDSELKNELQLHLIGTYSDGAIYEVY